MLSVIGAGFKYFLSLARAASSVTTLHIGGNWLTARLVEVDLTSMHTDLYYGSDSLPQAFSTIASGASRALVIKVIQPDTVGEVVTRVIDLGKHQGCIPTLIHVDEIDKFFATSSPVSRSNSIAKQHLLEPPILLLIAGVMSASDDIKDKMFRFLFRGDSLNYITVIIVSDHSFESNINSLKLDFPLSTLWFSQPIK